MNNPFPPEVQAALNKMNKERVKAAEFETPLTLQFIGVEKIKSQYGAESDASIVERGVLEEGEQFLYTFKDEVGDIRKFYSHSFPFLIAMQGAELNENDWITISRTGKAKETKYAVEKADAPDLSAKPAESEINPEEIPF